MSRLGFVGELEVALRSVGVGGDDFPHHLVGARGEFVGERHEQAFGVLGIAMAVFQVDAVARGILHLQAAERLFNIFGEPYAHLLGRGGHVQGQANSS